MNKYEKIGAVIGLTLSVGFGASFCFFGLVLTRAVPMAWSAFAGVWLFAIGFAWLVAKATDKP